MIKTIDTNEITEEMFKAFRLGDDLSGKIFNLLKAAPEVKTQPIGTLILGGIVGNEYDEIDIDFKSKALEALQEELVSSENPVVLKVYAHPPAIDDETKRMALELCRLIIDKAGPDSMITRAMAQKAEKISERLEAGE